MRTRTLPRHARTGLLAVGWRKARPHQGENAGELYPVWPILGGAPDDGDGDGDEGDDQDDDGDGSDTDDDGDDWSEIVKGWKAEGLNPGQIKARLEASRKWEDRAKKNKGAADELAKLKREGMSDTEAAVAAARAEERVKGGERIAKSAFLAAAKGRIANPQDVVDEINLSKYVDDDGEVDDDAIAELVDKLAPKQSDKDDGDDDEGDDERDTRRGRRGNGDRRGFDQGARGGRSSRKRQSSVAAGRDLWAEKHGKKTNT
ncbi:hypothetical protein OG331_31795 [Streptomyces sp. NBC_01017]|uniref:hypothetical protein n=1 Tax=Streptomyces sp. NBC_01017 TaxID=2903721 RepID=UPI0038652A79|nr:hypothetical protein OG331_31795 [Streptomyces sp. NBC_01017]